MVPNADHLILIILTAISTLSISWLVVRAFRVSGSEKALRQQIELLMTDLTQANQRIERLSQQLAETSAALATAQLEIRLLRERLGLDDTDHISLLAVFGPDPAITRNDLAALRQAGIPFKRLNNASSQDVKDELSRQRRADKLYRYIHIGSHANPSGVELRDRLADFNFWGENLPGVEGVVLSACSDIAVADKILGIVEWVISLREGIDNEDAWAFNKVFWSEMRQNASPEDAYAAACRKVPNVGEFADFRRTC